MKTFIEAIEDKEEGGEFIKEEAKTSIDSAITTVKAKLDSKKTYKLRKHICRHEEGQSCTVEEIETIKSTKM